MKKLITTFILVLVLLTTVQPLTVSAKTECRIERHIKKPHNRYKQQIAEYKKYIAYLEKRLQQEKMMRLREIKITLDSPRVWRLF